jgi:hypothetical protein
VVAATPHPTPLTDHELNCARLLTENALAQLREAYRLLNQDNALRIQAETAGSTAKRLREAIAARGQGRVH